MPKDYGAGLNSGKAADFTLTPESSNESDDHGSDDGDDDDDHHHRSDSGDGGGRRGWPRGRDGRDDKNKISMYSKPFGRKDTKAPYDGEVGGALWETKATNFLVIRVLAMVEAFGWTERQ